MDDENALLRAIVDRPDEADQTWLVLADWLDDHARVGQAELIRLRRQPAYRPDLDAAGRHARIVGLLVSGVRPCVPIFTNRFGMRFVYIEPGSFSRGALPDESGHKPDERPRHQVTLSRGFWLGETPVTQGEWAATGLPDPSHFRGRPDRPVEGLNWHDCVAFLAALRAADNLPYSMPTEAQWEFAARANTETAYFWGDVLPPGLANFLRPGGIGATTPVRAYPPNAWGLFDMHGNVWEWCEDVYGPYPDEPVVDPKGPPAGPGATRLLRGGAWHVGPDFARSGYRAGNIPPGNRWNNYGLRLCLPADVVPN